MTTQRGWNISTRTQILSLGPALLLTLLLISFFTVVRIQDLRQELNHTGQLIANQLAPASEYGVIVGNNDVLESLMKATMSTPHVRFLEVQDNTGKVLVQIDPRYYRPTEVELLLGDPSKAREKLGWQAEVSLRELVAMMVAEDLQQAKREILCKRNGFEIHAAHE